MLQFIRERAQSWIAWGIIGLIIVVFALWGIGDYVRSSQELPAAEVNGTDISQQQLKQAFYERRQQLAQMFGGKLDPTLFSDAQIRQQTLDSLIRDQLLLETAHRSQMAVGDGLLANEIRNMPVFDEDGAFSNQRYEQVLSFQNMSPRQFEASLRRDLMIRQLQVGVTETAFVTPAELANYQKLSNQTRDAGWLQLPIDHFTPTDEPTTEALQAYYDGHPDLYMFPERVQVGYLELSREKLAAGISVSEEELRDRYEAQKDSFSAPEQRRAAHILVEVPAGGDEGGARQKLDEIQAKLAAGVPFDELARQYSDDPGSAAQGGDLGLFGRGVMVKPFEDKVFSMQVGEISEPIRTEFGYHIIRLDEVKKDEVKPFEEVREQILNDIRMAKVDEQYFDMADRMSSLTYEHPESLDQAAEALGLTIEESPVVARSGGSGIFADPKVIAAAFSDSVLAGNNSDVIELGDGRGVVLHIREHLTATRQSFEEAKAAVSTDVKREQAKAMAKERASQAIERLRQGEEPTAVATELGGEWKRAEVKRKDPQLPPEVGGRLFGLPHPSAEQAVFEAVALGDGGQVVVALYAVKEGAATAPPAADGLLKDDGRAALDAFNEGLRKRANVTVNP